MTEDLLLVDDDVGAICLMDRVLAGVGHHRFATSGLEALRLAHTSRPDMVLLDSDMPGLDGLDVLRAMREDPELRDVPVIMVTSREDLEVVSLEAGAEDFVLKPLDHHRLLARVRVRLRERGQRNALEGLALLDPLTELANPRHFHRTLESEWARAAASGQAISLVFMTIDGLDHLQPPSRAKQRDLCVRSLGWVLQDSVGKPGDFIARLGTGAFALLLPDTACKGAVRLIRRVQRALADLDLDTGTDAAPHVLSVGSGIGWVRNAGSNRAVAPPGALGASRCNLVPRATELLLAAQSALQASQANGPGLIEVRNAFEYPPGPCPQFKIEERMP